MMRINLQNKMQKKASMYIKGHFKNYKKPIMKVIDKITAENARNSRNYQKENISIGIF